MLRSGREVGGRTRSGTLVLASWQFGIGIGVTAASSTNVRVRWTGEGRRKNCAASSTVVLPPRRYC
jgi:hypothetical protein